MPVKKKAKMKKVGIQIMTCIEVETVKEVPVFRESDEWRSSWDTAVLVAAMFNALAIPIVISFQPLWSEHLPYRLLDNLSNILFVADLLVVGNTAFFDKNNEEVTNRREIMILYLKGSFTVDFVSSIPWDYVFRDYAGIKVLNALKIVRILRIQKLISRLKFGGDQKAVSVGKVTFTAILNFAAGVRADLDHPSVHMPVVCYNPD